jgi:threonine/homoserine/homoserine lactone efflux protein
VLIERQLIAGIVAGPVMFALAQLGLAAVVARHTWLQVAILASGAIYLAAFGLLLVYCSFFAVSIVKSSIPGAPKGALPLFAFQFDNPKAWVLVPTVSAAARGMGLYSARSTQVLLLLLLFIIIRGGRLLALATLGKTAARILQGDLARARFDRGRGLLLTASAASLLWF